MDKAEAERLLRWAASQKARRSLWVEKIEKFSSLCEEEGASKTHIAFMGTTILAKVLKPDVDLYAIKPRHSQANPGAYSARSLCHGVLVPLAAEIGINLGVTGKEPLNNQPYFRMNQLGDDTPVHAGGRPAFEFMLDLIRELQASSPAEAQDALLAFVWVRKRRFPTYAEQGQVLQLSLPAFVSAVERFVDEDAEGGKRAQAVAAGLFDVFAGVERVESGRINDPSRKYPGDVCVRSRLGVPELIAKDAYAIPAWEKALEVRNKPVSQSDVQIFLSKCASLRVLEAAVLMASRNQPSLDFDTLQSWAAERGMGLTLFYGWLNFIEQALFWSAKPKPVAQNEAIDCIRSRLLKVEISESGLDSWDRLTSRREGS